MHSLPRTVAVLAVAATLVACGSSSEDAAPDAAEVDSVAQLRTAAAALTVGMSQDEVRNRLGEPRTMVTMDGGYERWTYYNYDAQGRVDAKTLVIFGDDGKIVEVNDM